MDKINPPHINLAIKQAKKEGNKKVISFRGDDYDHSKYSKLLEEGLAEVFTQKVIREDGSWYSVLLLRAKKIL